MEMANEAPGLRSVPAHLTLPCAALVVELSHEPRGFSGLLLRVAFPGPGLGVELFHEAAGLSSVSPHVALAGLALVMELTHESRGLSGVSARIAFPGPGLGVEMTHEPPCLRGVLLHLCSAGCVVVAQVPHELPRLDSHRTDSRLHGGDPPRALCGALIISMLPKRAMSLAVGMAPPSSLTRSRGQVYDPIRGAGRGSLVRLLRREPTAWREPPTRHCSCPWTRMPAD